MEALKVATNTRLPLSPLDPNRFEKGKEKEKQGGKVLGKRDRTLWCGYWRTRERRKVSDKEKGKGKGGGREDLWISLKEDGKFWLTIVSVRISSFTIFSLPQVRVKSVILMGSMRKGLVVV